MAQVACWVACLVRPVVLGSGLEDLQEQLDYWTWWRSRTRELRLASYEGSPCSVPSSQTCGSLARKSRLVSVNADGTNVMRSLTSK